MDTAAIIERRPELALIDELPTQRAGSGPH